MCLGGFAVMESGVFGLPMACGRAQLCWQSVNWLHGVIGTS